MECMKLVSCILFGKVFQHIMYMRPVVADIPHYVPYNSSSGGWVGAGSMALFCRWFESGFPDKHPFSCSWRRCLRILQWIEEQSGVSKQSRHICLDFEFLCGGFWTSRSRWCCSFHTCQGRCPWHVSEQTTSQKGTGDPADNDRRAWNCGLCWTGPISTGYSWFLFYVCLRKNAGLGCEPHGEWLCPGKFFEATLLRTKTARSQEKKTTCLPMVSPAYGLLGVNWCEAFFACRINVNAGWPRGGRLKTDKYNIYIYIYLMGLY